MNTIFFLFVVTLSNNGYETMTRVNDVNYQSKAKCEIALKRTKVKSNQKLFCGEDYLYFNKTY